MGFLDGLLKGLFGNLSGNASGSPAPPPPPAPTTKSGRPQTALAPRPRPPRSAPATRPAAPARVRSPIELPPPPEQVLAVLPGTVAKVDPDRGFAVVNGGLVGGIVFSSAAPPEGLGSLRQGQPVDFVVVRRDTQTPGRYVLSLALPPEVRARQGLDAISVGDRVEVEVVGVGPRGASVRHGHVPGTIDAVELAHHHVPDPSIVVAVGDRLPVEVLAVHAPPDWRTDRFRPPKHAAGFSASLRATLPTRPDRVEVYAAATPFQITARANLPRRLFDDVVQFVFRALSGRTAPASVVEHTGLAAPAVQEITAVLQELGLLGPRGGVTGKGREVLAAIDAAAAFNARPTDGWFLSDAPPGQTLLRTASAEPAEPPAGWPAPLRHRGRQEAFLRAPEAAIEDHLGDDFFDDETTDRFRALLGHRRVRLFVEPDRGRRRDAPVRLSAPDAWPLGLLWRAFEPAEDPPPFQPAADASHAERLLVAELERPPLDGTTDDVPPQVLYWEPATDTLWHPHEDAQVRLRPVPRRAAVPDLPPDLEARLPDAVSDPSPLQFVRWVRVEHRPRRRSRRP